MRLSILFVVAIVRYMEVIPYNELLIAVYRPITDNLNIIYHIAPNMRESFDQLAMNTISFTQRIFHFDLSFQCKN